MSRTAATQPSCRTNAARSSPKTRSPTSAKYSPNSPTTAMTPAAACLAAGNAPPNRHARYPEPTAALDAAAPGPKAANATITAIISSGAEESRPSEALIEARSRATNANTSDQIIRSPYRPSGQIAKTTKHNPPAASSAAEVNQVLGRVSFLSGPSIYAPLLSSEAIRCTMAREMKETRRKLPP